MSLFIFLPAHLPMAPRPLQKELLSSWLGRLAAANALGFEELLDVLRVRLASSPRAGSFRRRFRALELWWFNHETNLFYDAKNRLIPQPQILPGYCVHCLREQTQRGEPAHLRAEWTLAFLTHCPQHRDMLWFCCSDCRDVVSMGWGLGRGQPPTRGCGRCALRPEIAFWETPQPLSRREERVLALETALLAAVASEGRRAQRVADPRWVGVVKPEDFVRLVGELMAMLSWPDACGGTHLLAHLQQGSCSAHAYVSGPLPLGSQAFGRLRQQERFELLAGVVKLLGTGPVEEDQPRGDPNPFCCVYGPMSASGRRKFLARLQSWPERVRVKALAAATCF